MAAKKKAKSGLAAIKRDKWVTAKVKVTRAGKVLAKVPASAVHTSGMKKIANPEKKRYEIRLSKVPDGAYTEDYLGHSRYAATKKEALSVVAKFYAAMAKHPEDFEPGMKAEIIDLRR